MKCRLSIMPVLVYATTSIMFKKTIKIWTRYSHVCRMKNNCKWSRDRWPKNSARPTFLNCSMFLIGSFYHSSNLSIKNQIDLKFYVDLSNFLCIYIFLFKNLN